MGGIHQQSSTYGWFMVVYCCFTSIESTTCAQAASFPGPTASLHLVPNVHPVLHFTKDFQHSLYTATLYLIPDGLGTVGYASPSLLLFKQHLALDGCNLWWQLLKQAFHLWGIQKLTGHWPFCCRLIFCQFSNIDLVRQMRDQCSLVHCTSRLSIIACSLLALGTVVFDVHDVPGQGCITSLEALSGDGLLS